MGNEISVNTIPPIFEFKGEKGVSFPQKPKFNVLGKPNNETSDHSISAGLYFILVFVKESN